MFLFSHVSGTRVERVFAKDEDGPEGPNGQITYSIVSTHNKFVIDPKTGWLSTNAVSVKRASQTGNFLRSAVVVVVVSLN